MEETHPFLDLSPSNSQIEFMKGGWAWWLLSTSCVMEWAFWLEFQSSGFYFLLILCCLVQSCILNPGVMVSTDVQKGPLESHRSNGIWSSILYANGSIGIWYFSPTWGKNVPWGEGFAGSLRSQLIWFSNPNTYTGFPTWAGGLNSQCCNQAELKLGLSLNKSFLSCSLN